MAWIELHDTLPDHEKVADMADMLKMDKDMVVGKLVRLWTWAINNRSDGKLKPRDVDTIAEVMRFKGKPRKLLDALLSVRMIDVSDDGYCIHDWEQYAGMLMAKREAQRAQNRARQQRRRDKEKETRDGNANVTRDITRDITLEKRDSNAVTVPIPYLTVPDDDDEYIVIREQEHALRAALVDEAPEGVVYDLLASLVEDGLKRVSYTLPDRERTELIDFAMEYGSALVLCEAIKAAEAAKATVPAAYIRKCIEVWGRYNLDTPGRLKAAQSELAILTNRRTSVSEDLEEKTKAGLREKAKEYSEDPYGAKAFNVIRENMAALKARSAK